VKVQSFVLGNPKIKIFFNEDFIVGRENEDGTPRKAPKI
jgi:hypothetical protein